MSDTIQANSSICPGCSKRDTEIARMRGEIIFHKREQESWRKLYEEQRGGDVFNAIQRELADVRCELITLKQKNRVDYPKE